MNINDDVRVKLTDDGWRMLEEHFQEGERILPLGADHVQRMIEMYRRRTDADGWTTFQLWDLMHIFGPELYMGNMKIPFDRNEIQIPVVPHV